MFRIDYSINGITHNYPKRYKSFRRVVLRYIDIYRINHDSWIYDEDTRRTIKFIDFDF